MENLYARTAGEIVAEKCVLRLGIKLPLPSENLDRKSCASSIDFAFIPAGQPNVCNLIEVWEGQCDPKDDTRAMAPLRILLVEDDFIVATLLAEVLVFLGHSICAIVNSEPGAIVGARRCHPDLMIVDAGLEIGNGISAVEKILELGFVPHLFVSGDALRVKVLRPGAVILQKPFREINLVRAIRPAVRMPFHN